MFYRIVLYDMSIHTVFYVLIFSELESIDTSQKELERYY
jgi:hypothetical protein